MKKLVLVAALAFVSLTTYAQETEEVTSAATEAMEEVQDNFAAIDLAELPAAITEALAKDHPEATISKAYANEEGQYKLEVAKADGTEVTLFADAEGNWLEM